MIISGRFKQRKAKVMVINSIQYGMKQSIVDFLTLLTAPVEMLAESKIAASMVRKKPEIATALNRSRLQM